MAPKSPPYDPALTSAIEEARLILSRHDGCHHAHSDLHALLLMKSLGDYDPEMMEGILQRMRILDRTGVYPTLPA